MAAHYTQVSTEFVRPGPADPAAKSLVLEQTPYPTDSGDILTMQEIADANGLEFIPAVDDHVISSDIEEIYELYYAQCGKNSDGSVTATINVFKTPTTLDYKLVTNSGEFGSNPITESSEKEESVIFRLGTSVDLGVLIDSIVSITWEGDVYNASGSIMYPAVPTANGTHLVVDEPVYGVCRITYTVYGDTWTLNVPPRDDNTYQATVFAFWGDNQVEELEVSFPNLSSLCDQSYQICVDDDCEQSADGEEEGDGTSTTLQLVAYDYCSGAAISGATFWVGGVQVPATGHTVKRGVTYSIVVKASGYKDSNTDDLSDNDSFSV